MLISECVVVQVRDCIFNVHRDLIFNFEQVIDILERFLLKSHREDEFFVTLGRNRKILIS